MERSAECSQMQSCLRALLAHEGADAVVEMIDRNNDGWIGVHKHAWTCIDVFKDMSLAYAHGHLYRHAHSHVCSHAYRCANRHVYRHVYRHMYRHVYRHACGHVCRPEI